jgi:uncharacterized protein
MAKIKLNKKPPINPVVIEAFPSKGYVSTIAASYMIKKLDMELIGYIRSQDLEAVTVVHENMPMWPIRIYSKDNLVLIFSEIMIPLKLIHSFSEYIADWIGQIKAEEVILLANIMGIHSEGDDHRIYGIACGGNSLEKLKDAGVKLLDEGVLTGMSSSLMLRCMEKGMPSLALMVETHYVPDVLAASSMLTILNKILDIEIDVKGLEETGKEIEKQVMNFLEQFKKAQEGHQQLSELPMYR